MFNVKPEEFIEAKSYFATYPHRNFKKRKDNASHSFIKLEMDDLDCDPIFAIGNKHEGLPLLGEGGSAKVKRVKNAQGQEFALKIEGGKHLSMRKASDPSLIVMRHVDFFKGQTTRTYTKFKIFLEKEIDSKRYTLLELIEGETLFSILMRSAEDATLLSPVQKRLIALALCQNLYALHRANFVHCDVTPSNFVITRLNHHDIVIRIIDFDFALILSPLGYATWDSARGTRDFVAPETLEWNRYSKYTDIYGLGCIFELLDIPQLSERMRNYVPHERPMLEQIILFLVNDIQLHFGRLEGETHVIKQALRAIKPFVVQTLKQYPPLQRLLDLKLLCSLTEAQRCIIALRCCQAVLTFTQHGKHFDLSAEKLTVYLDERSIDVYHNFELLPQDIDEALLVYKLGEIIETLGLNPGRLPLTEVIPFLINQFPSHSKEPLPLKLLEEISRNIQEHTRRPLTISASSFTSSSGSSSFTLNLQATLKDLIDKNAELEPQASSQTLSSLPSTTSPHSAISDLPDFELTPHTSTTAAAAAAATMNEFQEKERSFTPQAKVFGTLRRILHIDTAARAIIPRSKNLSKR